MADFKFPVSKDKVFGRPDTGGTSVLLEVGRWIGPTKTGEVFRVEMKVRGRGTPRRTVTSARVVVLEHKHGGKLELLDYLSVPTEEEARNWYMWAVRELQK